MTTAAEVEQAVRQRIQAAGLSSAFLADRSQFLEFPDGLFVEVVVRDGTKLLDFQKILDEISQQTSEKVEGIVRAEWQVSRVCDPRPAYSSQTGGVKAAELYTVDLEAGAAQQQVYVEVTVLAKMTFRDHGIEGDEIKNIVAGFVKEQLKRGGSSYWDPVRSPNLEITGDTARQILSRTLLLKKRAV